MPSSLLRAIAEDLKNIEWHRGNAHGHVDDDVVDNDVVEAVFKLWHREGSLSAIACRGALR